MAPASSDRRRIAFLDVDGTILEHGDAIAPSTVDAIRAARANGHLVWLCTGRSAGDIHPDVLAIGNDGIVSNGGALAEVGDEEILSVVMNEGSVRRLLAYFAEHDVPFFLQTHEGAFASDGVGPLIDDFRERLHALHVADDVVLGREPRKMPTVRYRSVADADLTRISKAVFLSEHADTLDRVRDDLKDEFDVIPGSMPMPGGSNGEISLKGITKGSAILAVLARLGIDPADAIGIGDSWNDVEMFAVCGTSVAMGNAAPELQARADRVTTAVLDDGVSNAFRDLGLL